MRTAPNAPALLIDYEINDEGALQTRMRTAEYLSRSLCTLIFMLRARGCTPVLTIMPSTQGRDRPTGAETLHRALCRKESVHLVGAADLFRQALHLGGRWEQMLRDPFHIAFTAAPIVAAAFARAFRALDAAPATLREWSSTVLPTRVIPAVNLVPARRRVSRASGHRGASHAVLRQGDRLNIPVGSGEQLLGLVINCGAPGAKVSFAGNGRRVVKHLVIYFNQKSPDQFLSVLVDLTQTVPGSPSGVDVEVLPADAEETEPTLHQQPMVRGRYGEIEIEGFLVASSSPVLSHCTGLTRPGVSCDLGGVIDSESIAAQLAMLGTAGASLGGWRR